MKVTNYSILQENTLAGFSETAGCLYLRLLDIFQNHERKAFLAAREYEEKCGKFINLSFRKSLEIAYESPEIQFSQSAEDTLAQLSDLFAKRWLHNFMDQGQ